MQKHVRVATDEEECHGVPVPVPAFYAKSRARGVVLGLLLLVVFTIMVLLGTSTPEGAALKALIMKFSSNVGLQASLGGSPFRGIPTGLCTNGKFKNAPRIRKEWRELDENELKAVQEAFWRLRGYKRVASGGNKAGFAVDSEWDTTLKGQAKCEELNQGLPVADQNPYCGYFTNYDEIVALHACSVKDMEGSLSIRIPGHTGPHFMNFHRMVILKMELALLAADANRPMKVRAIPYWDQSLDSEDPVGKYTNDPNKFIYSENYFGEFWTEASDRYAVVNGLFAEWPVSVWTEERFGPNSELANRTGSMCIRSGFFPGTVATKDDCGEDYTPTRWFRDHVECSQYVTRQPDDPNGAQAYGPLCGHYGICFSKEEFDSCSTYPENVRSWMQWNTCQDPGLFFCDVPRDTLLLAPIRARLRDAVVPAMKEKIEEAIKQLQESLGDGTAPPLPDEDDPSQSPQQRLILANAMAGFLWHLSTNLEANATTRAFLESVSQVCDDPMIYGYFTKLNQQRSFPRMQHGQAHFKAGRDFFDVTTSANDCGQFTQHADEDRSNMRFILQSLLKNPSLEDDYWHYPRTQFDVLSNGKPPFGLSGPFTTAGLLACNTDFENFPFYRWLAGAWTPGTLLRDVVNAGFSFVDLFNSSCPADEDCSGRSNGGYTNQEAIYYTHPARTPYTYDTLAEYFDPDCDLL